MEAGGGRPEGLLPQPPVPPLAPREIWKLRDLLMFVVFIPFALLASKLVVLIGYVVLRPFTGWHVRVDGVQSDTVFLLVQQCVFYVFILGFLFLLAKLQHQQPFWKSLGWKKPTAKAGGGLPCRWRRARRSRQLGVVAAAGYPGIPPGAVVQFPDRLFRHRRVRHRVAPVVEELVFRGLLFAVLERTVGLRFAVVTTAVLFAGLHIPEYWHAWNHMILILAVGMVFRWRAPRPDTLLPASFFISDTIPC